MLRKMAKDPQKILIIKLGALGDFIQSMGVMRAIRHHHKNATITLLTTKPFENIAQKSGYVDTIWLDKKPKLLNPIKWINLQQKLNKENFDRIYDLQNNDRSNLYFRLLKSPKPEWVGTAKGASHRNTSPERSAGRAFEGHKQTLALAGIENIEIDPLKWLDGDITAFKLNPPYALFVAGCAPQHPHKRWPAENYAYIANQLIKKKIQPILIGTNHDAEANAVIKNTCPEALDLTNQTDLDQITALARNASIAIGNDTGPMHLIAATGCPTLSLFSGQTNPKKHAPRGENVTILQSNNIDNLKPDEVAKTLHKIL